MTNGLAYGAAGFGLWYALQHGGIHATIAGVILGLMIPAAPQRSSRDVLQELGAHLSLPGFASIPSPIALSARPLDCSPASNWRSSP